MKPRVRAQLHSSSARSSKILKDHTQLETVVEVAGVGRLILDVDSKGGYSLRAYPEDSEDPSRDLLAVGVVQADGIVAVHPEGLSADDGRDRHRADGGGAVGRVHLYPGSVHLHPVGPPPRADAMNIHHK